MACGWSAVQATLANEFSGATDVQQWTELLVRLTVAVLLAGLLGYDRERKERPAGLRTHMLVGLGAATLALMAEQGDFSDEAMARVIEGVVTGIGFLGAGAIIKLNNEGRIRGLTTAGSVWATAAVGIAAGLGHEITAVVVSAFAFFILAGVSHLEQRLAPKTHEPDHDKQRVADHNS